MSKSFRVEEYEKHYNVKLRTRIDKDAVNTYVEDILEEYKNETDEATLYVLSQVKTKDEEAIYKAYKTLSPLHSSDTKELRRRMQGLLMEFNHAKYLKLIREE